MEREEFKILVKAMKAVYAQPTFIPDKDAFDVWYGLLQDVCPTLTSQSMGICRIERIVRGGGQDGMQHSDNLTERSTEMAKVVQISNEGSQCGSVYSDNGNSPTLTAGTHGDANSKVYTEYRIRKLTPKECWRLMDFSDADFHKAEKVNSNTQLYKQAGNSIVVNVLVAILGQLFIGKEDVYRDCKVKK